VHEARELRAALLELSVQLGEVPVQRAEPAENLVQVTAAALQATTGAGEEQA
jgi:hypothetical protein